MPSSEPPSRPDRPSSSPGDAAPRPTGPRGAPSSPALGAAGPVTTRGDAARSAAPRGADARSAAARPAGADEERVQPADRIAWRAWLEANHETARGVWAVTYRRTSGKPVVAYDDLIEEALCFGWIDGQARALDDERTMLRFTPRRKGGTWAKTNKARVERLLAEGLMTPAGLRAIEAAKADGSWDALADSDALVVPDDLGAALAADAAAGRGFDALPPSAKKPVLYWVTSAKRPETRARRVAEIVRHAAVGRSPLDWPRRPLEE